MKLRAELHKRKHGVIGATRCHKGRPSNGSGQYDQVRKWAKHKNKSKKRQPKNKGQHRQQRKLRAIETERATLNSSDTTSAQAIYLASDAHRTPLANLSNATPSGRSSTERVTR